MQLHNRPNIDVKAVHDGKIVNFLEVANTVLPAAKKGAGYNNNIIRKNHTVAVTLRDYSTTIINAAFGSVIPLNIPSGASSPVQVSVTWSIVSVSLPAGLTLDPNTGQIQGTPTVAGTFSVNVRVFAAKYDSYNYPLNLDNKNN